MEEFKVIYKILKILLHKLETGELDMARLEASQLGISEYKRKELFLMLQKNGYIEGVFYREYVDGGTYFELRDVKITLKGLEYLEENSLMQKAKDLLKGVISVSL